MAKLNLFVGRNIFISHETEVIKLPRKREKEQQGVGWSLYRMRRSTEQVVRGAPIRSRKGMEPVNYILKIKRKAFCKVQDKPLS